MGRYRQKMMWTIRSNVERSLSDYCIHTMTREIKTISITSWNDHLFFYLSNHKQWNSIRGRLFFVLFFLFVQSADDKTRPCVCVTDISIYIQPASHFNQLYSFRDCLFSCVIALYCCMSQLPARRFTSLLQQLSPNQPQNENIKK